MADLKATRCGELPKNEFSPQTEQLISLLERRGIVEDHSIVNEKARQAEQALRRNMYHNTQMMLKHYRDIVWALECFPEQVAEELDRPLKDLDALLSMVDTQLAMGNTRLEHRMLSIKQSRLLLDRLAVLNEEMGATILMVTHDAFSASYCSRILFLRDGKIFHELLRGEKPRRRFLQEILDVLSFTGGKAGENSEEMR